MPILKARKNLAIGCLGLLVVLFLCSRVLGGGSERGESPTATAVVPSDATGSDIEPVATEALAPRDATETPEDKGELATIPGLVAVDIYGNLEKRGFTCERNSTSEGFVATCRDAQGNDVVARGAGPMSMNLVTATCLGLSGGDEECRTLLGFVASVPYDGSEPDSATAWAKENVGKNAETVFGGAKFRVIAVEGGTARILEITPAEQQEP